jgi:hypothetical protein
MVARKLPQEYRKLNKGVYNVEDSETIPNGFASDALNVIPLATGGYKKRCGTKKQMSTQNTGKIVAMPYLEDRYFNKNKLTIENSGKFSKWNSNDSITDYSAQVVLKAAEKYGTVSFFKGVSDYLIIANGGGSDYVKKVQYTPDGTWSELGTSVTGTESNDNIAGIRYVSSTEIYVYVSDGAAPDIYLWNGSSWASYCNLIDGLTIHNYFALEGTDYVYAATSEGVYVFSDSWNFWMRLGSETAECFDVLAISTSEVYAVKSTKIRRYTTTWADVKTINAVSDYGLYYLNLTFICIEKGTINFWTSTDGSTWTARTISYPGFNTTEANMQIDDACTNGTNICFACSLYGYDGDTYYYDYFVSNTNNYISFTPTNIVNYTGSRYATYIAYGGTYYTYLISKTISDIYYCTNPLSSWTGSTTVSGIYIKIKYTSNKFIMHLSNSTSIQYSISGSSWTSATCSTKCDFLTYKNGNFKAIGLDTTIKQAYSADGATWQALFTHFKYVSATESYGCKADGVYYFNGTTWAEIGTLTNIAWLEYVSSTELYAATTAGLYKWTGASWALHQTLIGSNDIRQMLYVSPTEMYAAVYGSGVYKFNGTAWTQYIGNIGSNNNIKCLGYSTNRLLAGAYAEGVYNETDTKWSTLNLGDELPDETTPKKVTITATSGASCTVASTADLYPGCFMKHASIPDYAYVVSVTNATTFVLSVSIANTTYTDCEVIYAPIAKHVAIYNNMVWLANLYYSGRAEPAQVMISNIGDMDDWRDVDQTAAGLTGYRIIQLGTGESDVINGMANVNGRLVVFKGKSTYSISSTAPDSDNTTSQKISDAGCIASGSIQVVNTKNGDIAIFLSDHGFFATDGSNVYPISEQISYTMNSTYYSAICSMYDREKREYRVCIPSTAASTECDLTLILDLDDMGWWPSSVKATAMGVWDEEQFIAYDRWIKNYASANDRDDINYDDAYWSGDQISGTYTLAINPPNQLMEKELREIYLQFDGSTTVTFDIYKDGVLQYTKTGAVQDTMYPVSVKGKNFEVKITQNEADTTFKLYGIIARYKVLTER